jgi:DNA polymerase delta subunit 1
LLPPQDNYEEDLLANLDAPGEDETSVQMLGAKDIDMMAERWRRPPHPPLDPATDEISLNQFEADYSVTPVPSDFAAGSRESKAATVRMFGVTAAGNSVLVHVHGFRPYFYVRAPPGFGQEHIGAFTQTLNARLGNMSKDNLISPVCGIGLVKRQSIMHYNFNKMAPFLRVVVALPGLVATCRRLMEQGVPLPGGGEYQFETFESNCAYALRYMVDRDIVGCNWVSLPASKWRQRPWNAGNGLAMGKVSHCQLEVDVFFADVVSHKAEGEWMGLAPMRILSFDIECAGRPGVFPEAEHDPVIQIANHVCVQGSATPVVRNVFTLKQCSSISGAQVLSFDTEEEMLKAWHRFLIEADVDILTGYNIVNFDLPYLLNRAAALKLGAFPYLGRMKGMVTRIKDKLFQSKQVGTRESKEINIEGRVQFDVLQVLQRDHKLSSYSLNAVCAHFLGEQKEDVHHSIISDLQAGNADTRRRLAVYCLKDAYLPQRLLQKLMCLINYVEMARVCGVPLSYLLTRGQQIKVMSQLYRKAKTLGLVLPVQARKQVDGAKFEGATVIEPVKGFYKDPVATLDFASLYPSIMMAHNLCYSTLVRNRNDLANIPPDQLTHSPTGDYFVKASTQKGILPQILEELLGARKKAKKDMKNEKDPFKYAVYDGRQLALKISANSVYGFTGAQVGQLPCLEISSTVTGFGRQMIESTKNQVEAHYSRQNGHEHDAQVIYGDTDSVMIKFGTTDLAESMRLGEEAAGIVTKTFIEPIKLEFEKVYYPYLLMNKKRYAGLLWTNTTKHDKMDCKGIETVRRDNCDLVKEVVETSLRAILIRKDPQSAVEYIKGCISELLLNKMDLSKLVVTKALTRTSDQYASGNKQAHVELAARIKKRDPGLAPAVGDRIPYVMIKGAVGAKAWEKAEDPIYVLENNLPIDTAWYLEHQLSEPIKRLFEPILPDNVNSLLEGDHTRRIHKATPTTGGLMKFAKVTKQCLGCRSVLKGTDGALCAACEPKQMEVYCTKLKTVQSCEQLFSRLWTQCQRCQGDLHKDVLCTSRDCPIFYKRKKVQKDLRDAKDVLRRFDADW